MREKNYMGIEFPARRREGGLSKKTVRDVINEWRQSGADQAPEADANLASRINYYIAVETKGWKDEPDGVIGERKGT